MSGTVENALYTLLAAGIPITVNGNPISGVNPLPIQDAGTGVVTLVSNSTSVAGGSAGTLSIPAASGKFSYLRGFSLTAVPATAVVSGQVSITGPTNTLFFDFTNLVAGTSDLTRYFGEDGIQGTAQNIAIVVNIPIITGGANYTLTVWGYQL
jgi:hypothetical protein